MQLLSVLQEKASAKGARLVVVSKNQPIEKVQKLYEQGQRLFAENRVQPLLERKMSLPADIEWHLIGHLQTNKVKSVVPFVQMIHSIDSLRLLAEVNQEAAKIGRCVDCLLQFHIAEETNKYGLDEKVATEILQSADYQNFMNVRVCGVMGMATFTEDQQQIRQEFRNLKQIFEHLKQNYFPQASHFREISMGMSGDWEIALEEGSTLLRIGSLLFD